MGCERTHWNTWLGVEGEKWEEKDTGFSQAGWMAEATSLDMGWEEEGVQKPTPFLPDPSWHSHGEVWAEAVNRGATASEGWRMLAAPLCLLGHNGCLVIPRNTPTIILSLSLPRMSCLLRIL